MKQLNESQSIPLPEANLPPIPGFQEHELEVKKLWLTCRYLAIATLVVVGLLTAAMFAAGMDAGKAVAVSTIVFQAILLSYGMGFFVPSLITSLKRLGLSVHMMYESLRMGRETVEAMKSVQGEAEPLFVDGRVIVDQLKPIVDKLTPETLDRLEGYLQDVRDRVVRDTEPLPAPRRPESEAAATGLAASREGDNGTPS